MTLDVSKFPTEKNHHKSGKVCLGTPFDNNQIRQNWNENEKKNKQLTIQLFRIYKSMIIDLCVSITSSLLLLLFWFIDWTLIQKRKKKWSNTVNSKFNWKSFTVHHITLLYDSLHGTMNSINVNWNLYVYSNECQQ